MKLYINEAWQSIRFNLKIINLLYYLASATLNNNMLMGLATSAEESHPPKTFTEVVSERPDCISTNLDKVKDCTYFSFVYLYFSLSIV